MKSILSTLFTIIILATSFSSIAQNNYSITPIQAGTIHLGTGKAVVELSPEIKERLKDISKDASYYIVFTPLNDAPLPSVSDKSSFSFAISKSKRSAITEDFDVDYVIYIKEKIQERSTTRETRKRLGSSN